MLVSRIKRQLQVIIPVVFLFLILGLASAVFNRYIIHIITLAGIFIIATVSLNLTNGYSGLFSLGHAGFMAVGAYTSTLLTFPVELRKAYDLLLLPRILGGPNYQWPFLPAVLMAGLLSGLVAVLVGAPVLRLRGHYLAVASLGFMVIVETLAINLRWLTRGSIGINAIPHYTNLWWSYAWVVVTLYVIWRIVHSSYGRAMMAIRDDEIAAQVQGINPFKYRLLSFAIGAFFAGVAGALYAHLTRAIMPYVFSFGLTFQIVIMLVMGGAGTMVGPVIGATLLVAFKYAMKPLEESLRLYGFTELIYAALLILMMIKRPKGIIGGERQLLIANKALLYLRRTMHGLRLGK